MPKKVVFGIVSFVLVALASVGYLVTRPDEPRDLPSQSSAGDSSQKSDSALPTETNGKYDAFSQDKLAAADGDVYLFFHASWCPQCRSIESGIESQGVPSGITILKVDYDSNQALRQKYGVTIQTTFVKVTQDGEFISRYVAYDEPTFEAVKENFF